MSDWKEVRITYKGPDTEAEEEFYKELPESIEKKSWFSEFAIRSGIREIDFDKLTPKQVVKLKPEVQDHTV